MKKIKLPKKDARALAELLMPNGYCKDYIKKLIQERKSEREESDVADETAEPEDAIPVEQDEFAGSDESSPEETNVDSANNEEAYA